MTHYPSNHTFNDALALSMPDKLFFRDLLPEPDVVVDFGCGDGTLLKVLTQDWPGIYAIGIETNVVRSGEAKRRLAGSAYVTPWFSKNDMPVDREGPSVAIFSSVLHESLWLLVEAVQAKFDWIVIRDMALSEKQADIKPYLDGLYKVPYRDGPRWEEEELEDYFQLSPEKLMDPPPGYGLFHFEHYLYRPAADLVKERTGVEITIPTHVKAIWRRT